VDKNENAEERVTDGGSARKGRIDLTQFESMEDNRSWSASWYPAEEEVEPDFLIEGGAEGYKVRIVNTQGGITLAYIANGNEVLAKQIAKLPELIAELEKQYKREDELLACTNSLIAELEKQDKREDELLKALLIIRDDLDDALKVYPILNKEDVEKVRNFANDASQ
jgi:molecular chaperone GrpE (heat shock protein)